MANTGPVRRVDVEQAAAFDDEADFVFVVPVLAVERASIASRFGVSGRHVDHVGRHVAAARLELVDLAGVGGEHASGGAPAGSGVSGVHRS